MMATLLPNGLSDLMPEAAEREAEAVYALMSSFKEKGYRRVKPPLIEFEDTLLSGPGQAMSPHMFRLMDTISQKMMGLRADITPQIARIAASRFEKNHYPLRLSYSGEVLHVKGSRIDPTRQFMQVGCELIGADNVEADMESIMVALQGLAAIGLEDITIDVSLPALLRSILDEQSDAGLMKALQNKNKEGITALAGEHKDFLIGLISLSGVVDDMVRQLESLSIPQQINSELERLISVISRVKSMCGKSVRITIDPTRHSPFDYHRGISYALYVKGVRKEIGRGGRYDFDAPFGRQTAIGFTLYMDALLRKIIK
jgi:ATP phosphoribosyltransferase regulatory subunit